MMACETILISPPDFVVGIATPFTASEKANGVFVIIDVEIENTGKSAKYLSDSLVKLVDVQGREFSPNTAAAIYLKPEGSALMFEQVNPGITKKGKIVYDVPENVKTFNVKITSSIFSSNIYNVKITT